MPGPAEQTALVTTIADLRGRIASQTGTVGLVPTMGALHAGHAALIGRARRECASVVVSIFVNPLQFDRPDDFQRYPRTLEADRELSGQMGADVVFAPSAAEMYPSEPLCTVEVSRIGDYLCGRSRPGHFRGVATVVLKLFGVVQPHRAYFGEKDAQQLAIVRRLVQDFNLPVTIVGIPTVREADGLALSSRNRHLNSKERVLAVALYHALCEARRQVEAGVRDSASIRTAATATIPDDPSLRLEYLEVVDPVEMQPVDVANGPVCIAGALWVGSTRLIDNVMVGL